MEKENTNKHTPFENLKCKVCRVHIFYVKVEIAKQCSQLIISHI